MNIIKLCYKNLFLTLFTLLLLITNFQVLAAESYLASGHGAVKSVKPDDFNKMLLYVSSKPFVSVDGSFLVDGLIQGDGLNFHSNVMGRSEEEINVSMQEAKDFFIQRFGLDLISGDIYFSGFEATPDINYHVVLSSGENVPPEGWVVHDGGWIAAVVNPAGVDLGGEYTGTHVPPGTMFVKGNYKIVKTSKHHQNSNHASDKNKNIVVIDYQARKPILVESDGSFAVSCELYNEKWGEGQAIGATLPFVLSDGRMVYNTRNVLTFPPFGKEVEPLR